MDTTSGEPRPAFSRSPQSFILTYHSLDDSGSPISIPPDVFRWQMRLLAESNITVVSLREIRRQPRAVAITFDDGFANFLSSALPVLREFRLPATVFAVSGYCGRKNDWPTQSAGIPILPLMDWAALRDISDLGIEIGAHTVHHPRLTSLSPAEMEQEMTACQTEIENKLGVPVRSLAYPYGESSTSARRIAGRHFDSACGVRLSYLDERSDMFDLPRLDAYYLQERFWFEQLTSPAGRAYIWGRRQLRKLRATLAS